MKRTFIRRATPEDVTHVSRNLIEADQQEVLASLGLPASLALPLYATPDRDVWVGGLADEPENPMLIYGCDSVPGEPDVGMPWLLCTPSIYNHPVELARALKSEWARFHADHPILTNYTDARNTRHHKLLKWLGCEFVRTVPFGPQSLPFIEFVSCVRSQLFPS